jgi:hypothetical protein
MNRLTYTGKIYFLLWLSIILVSPAKASELVPVTPECVYSSSLYHEVPLGLILAIMAVEAGTVGEYSENSNKSRDNGPMQINTIWEQEFLKKGITEVQLRNNGCLNVFAGSWILKKHINSTNDIWKAVGNYHSKTPKRNKWYQEKIKTKLRSLNDYKKVLKKANGDLAFIGEPKL